MIFFVAYHSVLQDNNIQLILIEFILFEFHWKVQFKRNIFLENGNFTIRKMLWSIFNRMLNSHSETNFFSKKNQVIFWTHPCKNSKKHQQKIPKRNNWWPQEFIIKWHTPDAKRNIQIWKKFWQKFRIRNSFRGHQIWI